MVLLLDIGNARIKWALQSEGEWKTGAPLLRKGKPFKDVARPAWKELDTPERVVVSNVAGSEYEKSVRTWIKRRWKITPEFLHSCDAACGVTNAYKEPVKLGADRWAALIGAHAHYPGPAVIVDCGTAITIDAIDARGTHLGGLIVPGMDLMKAALSGGLSGIRLNGPGDEDIALLGRSTERAVSGGILYAAVSLVDRVFQDIAPELGRSVTSLLTGGDAGRIQPLLSRQPKLDADLVLKGLAVFAEETECVT